MINTVGMIGQMQVIYMKVNLTWRGDWEIIDYPDAIKNLWKVFLRSQHKVRPILVYQC